MPTACCRRWASSIDTDDGVVRASFVHYTSEEEVGRLIEALDELLQV